MKKIFVLFAAVCFTLSACIPTAFQPQPAASPAPISDADIQATVATQVAQTVESLPTPTLLPSSTPFVITATNVPTLTLAPPTSTNTQTSTPSTPTMTLATGTVTATPATAISMTAISSTTPAPGATATGTAHYQYYGTMPPNLPSGKVFLSNMSKRDAYISMQCTTSDGYATVIEYPVGGSTISARVPAGNYVYVAWIGGKKFSGEFRLKQSEEIVIRMYKDHVEVK